VIRDDRIERVGTIGTLPIPADYERVCTEGATVRPGLWDLHVHLIYSGHPDLFFWLREHARDFEKVTMPAAAQQILSAGITSVRDLAAPTGAVFALRARIEAGELPGPTIYASGAALLPGENAPALPHAQRVVGAADAARKTAELADAGADVKQEDGYFNGVAKLADGGFVATRMRDENARMDEIEPGSITGRVFQWRPGGQLQPLNGTELSLPNGIDISADERYLFVTATFTQELVRFDRHVTPMSKRAVSLPMLPDNVHWDGDGKLLIAGPNAVDPAVCDGGRCASGWTVVEVDPETLAVTRLGGANANAAMQRASAAMRLGNEIWVGSTQDRIARFTLN
jgi:hypothetical protein